MYVFTLQSLIAEQAGAQGGRPPNFDNIQDGINAQGGNAQNFNICTGWKKKHGVINQMVQKWGKWIKLA